MLCPPLGVLPVPAGLTSPVRLQLLLSHIFPGSSFGAVPGCPGKGQLLPPEFRVYCGIFPAQAGTTCQWLEQDLAPGQAFPLAALHKGDALLTLMCRFQSLLSALREHSGASWVSRAPIAFLAFCHVTAHLILSEWIRLFCQLYFEGVGCRVWHSTRSRVLCSRRSFMGHAGFLAGV